MASGHVPGAVLFDWKKDINDPVRRDLLSREQLEGLLGSAGIGRDTWVVLYGDFNNWFAAFAFWVLKYYGVENVRLLNGGRKKWLIEDRPVTKDVPTYPKTAFKASEANQKLRVYREEVLRELGKWDSVLVDVRGPKEFSGEISGTARVPDGTRPKGRPHPRREEHTVGADREQRRRHVQDEGRDRGRCIPRRASLPDKQVVTYCRIGERSSHSWFVLTYLLGYPQVRNYDGSWTEWGNAVGTPIER